MPFGRPLFGGGRPRQVHFTTITSSSAVVTSSTQEIVTDLSTYINTYFFTAYGFDAGSDYWAYGPGFGSIASNTYTDNRATSRLIDSCYWISKDDGPTNPGDGQVQLDTLYFVIDGLSVPNDDLTFYKIVIDGVDFVRNEASYVASADGGTLWYWDEVGTPAVATNPFAGVNPDDFEVWVAR